MNRIIVGSMIMSALLAVGSVTVVLYNNASKTEPHAEIVYSTINTDMVNPEGTEFPEPETVEKETGNDITEEPVTVQEEKEAVLEHKSREKESPEAEGTGNGYLAGNSGSVSTGTVSSNPQSSGNTYDIPETAGDIQTAAETVETEEKEKVWVVDKPEEVNYYPVWKTEYHDVCNECGMILDGGIAADHLLETPCSSYSTGVPFDVQDGWYEEIIPEEGHWEYR